MSQTSTTRGTSFIDPQTVMRIKNLQMRARVVVEGFFAGIHRSPYHGFSVEFSEYRAYTPGDDPRYLDWKLFARTDRYCVKRFEDETNLLCYLVVDMSRSMGLRLRHVHEERLCPHDGRVAGVFSVHAARRRGPAHVRRRDHRFPAAAASSRPPAASDGRAGSRDGAAARPILLGRWNKSPNRSASAAWSC